MTYEENKHIPISSWAESEQPREKMMRLGSANLSDSELVAILIGTGTVKESAVDLAKGILRSASNNLHELGRKSIRDLMKHRGIGAAKAVTISAALEIGRRRSVTEPTLKPRIVCSQDVYNIMAPLIADLNYEEFWLLHLNRSGKLLHKERLSAGGVAGTVVDAKMIFKSAVQYLSSAIIVVHNHPSGSLKPSQNDINITRKLIEAGKVLDIVVNDHIIISESGYTSYSDDGWG